MKEKTQEECRQEYKAFLEEAIGRLTEIDDNTPSNGNINCNPPKWWLEMSEVHRGMWKSLNRIKGIRP